MLWYIRSPEAMRPELEGPLQWAFMPGLPWQCMVAGSLLGAMMGSSTWNLADHHDERLFDVHEPEMEEHDYATDMKNVPRSISQSASLSAAST